MAVVGGGVGGGPTLLVGRRRRRRLRRLGVSTLMRLVLLSGKCLSVASAGRRVQVSSAHVMMMRERTSREGFAPPYAHISNTHTLSHEKRRVYFHPDHHVLAGTYLAFIETEIYRTYTYLLHIPTYPERRHFLSFF